MEFRYCPIDSYSINKPDLRAKMAEEIDFENGSFLNFDPVVTLTLTFDDLESGITRFVSLSPIHTYIVYMGPLSLIVDGRTYGRTDGRTDGRTTDRLYEVSSTELT